MSIEIMKREVEAKTNGADKETLYMLGVDKETLYMLGGVAMVIFGTGLVLSNPSVRRYLGKMGVGDLVSGALPDLERYFRLRSM